MRFASASNSDTMDGVTGGVPTIDPPTPDELEMIGYEPALPVEYDF